MRRLCLYISSLVICLVVSGCDSGNAPEWASPQVRVSLRDFGTASMAKSAALLDVALEIRTQGGIDYSPEPVSVDNSTESEVAFDVSIPADSIYSFIVRFSANGNLVAEGGSVEEVTLSTAVIDIIVVARNTASPVIAFLPSSVNTSTGSGNIDVAVRYYGAGAATAGIAALLEITGSTPRAFTLDGADLNFADGRDLNAAWQFSSSIQGIRDIGTLRLSRNQTADFCIEADADDVRVVDSDGAIRTADLQGTCIHVTP